MDLGRVGHNLSGAVFDILADLNGSGQGRPEHFECPLYYKTDLQRLFILIGLPAESEQLLHQISCPITRLENFLQIRMYWGLLLGAAHCYLSVTKDGSENIVEVVGNASCERTDGLVLLCSAK